MVDVRINGIIEIEDSKMNEFVNDFNKLLNTYNTTLRGQFQYTQYDDVEIIETIEEDIN